MKELINEQRRQLWIAAFMEIRHKASNALANQLASAVVQEFDQWLALDEKQKLMDRPPAEDGIASHLPIGESDWFWKVSRVHPDMVRIPGSSDYDELKSIPPGIVVDHVQRLQAEVLKLRKQLAIS